MIINRVASRSIFDTRERPTVETTLTSGPIAATASVPSGESTGSHEALELRDADGGVRGAVENVNGEIARAIAGRDFSSADELDSLLIALDGTPNKSRLGANAILSVSIAAQRLFAASDGLLLWRAIRNRAKTSFPSEVTIRKPEAPRLFINIMEGGAHAEFHLDKLGASKLPFQEYLLVVEGTMGTAFPIAQEAFAKIGERLGPDTPMGDEGGYAPIFDTLEKPFELLADIVTEFPGTSIAIDAAASELFHDGHYQLLDRSYAPDDLLALYRELVERFPIHSIEDPFFENAGSDFARLTAALEGKALVVGDDFTVTNPTRIEAAAREKQINAVIIKPNQIGTVEEALAAVQKATAAGLKIIASHRGEETHDTFIADFAYGIGAHAIKAGGLGQRERIEKYDRLRAIEREAESV